MSILIDKETKVLVQGITGMAAQHHTELMLSYGTNIIAGTRPGASGKTVCGVPVYNSVEEAKTKHEINTAVLFVPARAIQNAAFEAMDAGIKLVVLVSEHVPLHDIMRIVERAEQLEVIIIGPNTPGIIAPSVPSNVGFMPSQYYIPGTIGVMSRSGTLTYEIVSRLTLAGIGQTTCVGVGGDAIVGTTFATMLKKFEDDRNTKSVLLIGEIGGSMEEEAAELRIKGKITKPVVAYLAGRTAPKDKKVGHAGAIVSAGRGSIKSKLEAFDRADIPVAAYPDEVVDLISKTLEK